MTQPLASFTCPRTADCYLVAADERGRWTYDGQRVSLRCGNYFPDTGRIETRWNVSPVDEGMSWHTKALGAIASLSLTVASR
jgi:hypothetical protein